MSLWMVVEYFVVNWPNFRLPGFYYSIVSQYVVIHDCMCVCFYCACIMCFHEYVCVCVYSWRKVPEETYSDVPIFGLRTMYTVVCD